MANTHLTFMFQLSALAANSIRSSSPGGYAAKSATVHQEF